MMPIYPVNHVQPNAQALRQQHHRALSVCHLVDDQGQEIQITETMIIKACEALRRRCHLPHKA
ncbi:MAG: hypothetical protein RLY58_455 [Pseudomonadota bacterium]|jgi:hypothetical protein